MVMSYESREHHLNSVCGLNGVCGLDAGAVDGARIHADTCCCMTNRQLVQCFTNQLLSHKGTRARWATCTLDDKHCTQDDAALLDQALIRHMCLEASPAQQRFPTC